MSLNIGPNCEVTEGIDHVQEMAFFKSTLAKLVADVDMLKNSINKDTDQTTRNAQATKEMRQAQIVMERQMDAITLRSSALQQVLLPLAAEVQDLQANQKSRQDRVEEAEDDEEGGLPPPTVSAAVDDPAQDCPVNVRQVKTFLHFYFDEGPPGQLRRSNSAPVTSIERSMGTIRCRFGFACKPCEYMPKDCNRNTQRWESPPCRTNFCKRDGDGNVVDLPRICRHGVQCNHCHCHPKKNFQRLKARRRRWEKQNTQTG